MDYSDFLALVQAHAKQGGTSYLQVSDSAAYLALINRGLKSFTRFACSHFALNQPISFTAGTTVYDITPMFKPLKLNVNGSFIKNRDGLYAASDLGYFTTLDLSQQGVPTTWAEYNDQSIVVHPSATITGYLVGYVEHATISATGSVDVPLEYVDMAAMWIAQLLRYPHMQGSDLFEQILALDQFMARKLHGYRSANLAKFIGPIRRRAPYMEFYA